LPTSQVMQLKGALLVFLLYTLPLSSPLSCMMPCEPGQESTDERPCHICEELSASDCSSGELVEGICGCQECAKSAGEACGGPWEGLGRCAGSYICTKPLADEEWMMEMAEGVCCCPTKRVGGSEYRLKRLAGSPLPLECLSSCD